MCLREINNVMRYDVVKSDVIILRRTYLKRAMQFRQVMLRIKNNLNQEILGRLYSVVN